MDLILGGEYDRRIKGERLELLLLINLRYGEKSFFMLQGQPVE